MKRGKIVLKYAAGIVIEALPALALIAVGLLFSFIGLRLK